MYWQSRNPICSARRGRDIAPWNYPVNLALAPLPSRGNRGWKPCLPETIRTYAAHCAISTKPAGEVFPEGPRCRCAWRRSAFAQFACAAIRPSLFTGSTTVGRKIAWRQRRLNPDARDAGTRRQVRPPSSAKTPISNAPRTQSRRAKFFNAGQTTIAPDYVLIPPQPAR